MANVLNLISYRKGESGNRNGRPRGSRNSSTVLTGLMNEIAPESVVHASFIKCVTKGIKKPTIADALAARLVYEGVVNGQLPALREILDRTEGKAKQSIEIAKQVSMDTLVSVYGQWLDHCEGLYKDYGVPMPTREEAIKEIKRGSAAYNVDNDAVLARLMDSGWAFLSDDHSGRSLLSGSTA